MIKEKSLTIKQLSEFPKQDSYDKIHGKNLMPKNSVEVKSEPIQKIQRTNQKKQDRECYFCGKQNWTKEHECPARNSNCNKCNKKGHFAKVCKSKIKHIAETESEYSQIQTIQQISKIGLPY